MNSKAVLGAAGGMIAIPAIAEAVSVQMRKRARAEIIERNHGSAKRVLVAFPAFANSAASMEDMLPFFGSTNVLLVNYSLSGHDSGGLFEDILKRLKNYKDAELVLFGVSFGAGVAVSFRRYLLSHDPDRFRSVRFVLYSPVITGEDLRPKNLAMAALGFVLIGGSISNALWRATGGSKWLRGTAPSVEIEMTQERLAEIIKGIDDSTVILLASQARAILRGHRPLRLREFSNDAAVIFAFRRDPMIVDEAPNRQAKGFHEAEIVRLPESGHADIYHLRTLGATMEPAIQRLLKG